MIIIYRFLLRLALVVHTFLYKVISYLAIKTEGGLHPKHRLIGYHEFFSSNVRVSDSVLDIGCGNGANAYDVAKKAKHVTGIDIEEDKIKEARQKHAAPNITYVVGDATRDLGGEKFDVIILSNVLEHIEHRVEFMKSIHELASTYLIRVPMLDRDWIPLLKKEMGLEWRLDMTHFTEFTKESFYRELEEAGYTIELYSVQFGEIWAIVKP